MKFALFIPLVPLVGFLLAGVFRNHLSKSLTGILASGTVLISFVLSLLVFNDVRGGETGVIHLFDFIKLGKLSIPFEYQVDQLTTVFLLIITGVGFLIHVFSTVYMNEESPTQYARYFSFLNLFIFSMLLLVMGGNYVVMYMGWEGVGLCSYLLIGFWYKNKEFNKSAQKAFVMNRIGDFAFLLGIFMVIQNFGSTSFGTVFSQLPGEASTETLTWITILFLVGAASKSAQIPLYTWLPDAMAGPTPVSALIHAATMVTAGIYMIARSNLMYVLAPTSMTIVALVGLATALLAATIALRQNDIKKVLAYSTVSQLGYMFLGLGVGAFTGAVFHVMTHAFFKALLFLGAGSVIYAMHHEQDMKNYGGLGKYMPITKITMLIGSIAIAGIIPLSGFFSKDEILVAAYGSSPLYYILGMGGALLTAFYMFRLYTLTFMGEYRGDPAHKPKEGPPAMTIPLIVLAILSAVGGWIGLPKIFAANGHKLNNFLAPVFEKGLAQMPEQGHLTAALEWILIAVTTALLLGVIFYAIKKYRSGKIEESDTGIGGFFKNKWYVDEFYDTIINKPLLGLGTFFYNIVERSGIDRLVNGVGKGVQYGSRQIRHLQSGNVANYILIMVIAIVLLIRLVMYTF